MAINIPAPKELYSLALTTPWTLEDARIVRRVFYSNETADLTDDDIDNCLIAAIKQSMRLGRMDFTLLCGNNGLAELVARWRQAGYLVRSSLEPQWWRRPLCLFGLSGLQFNLDPPRLF